MPSCIESAAYGKDGYTTSVVDSLKEIQDFFEKVYKTADVEQAVLDHKIPFVSYKRP